MLSILCLSGCKAKLLSTKRKAISGKEIQMKEVTPKLSKVTDFQTLQFRGKGRFQGNGNDASFQYRIQIRKDSVVIASLSMLGIEGARLKITQDSIFLVDKLNNKLTRKNYAWLEEKAGMDLRFETLQHLLTGTPDLAFSTQWKAYTQPEQTILTASQGKSRLDYFLNPLFQLTTIQAEDLSRKLSSVIQLEHYREIEGKRIFPHHVHATVTNPQELRLTLEHQKIDWNPELNFQFRIPDGYLETP